MLKAEYLSFYTLSRLRFLERYLIENVANTMSESRFLNFLGEDSPRPLPSPKKLASPARGFRGSPQLKLRSAVPANDSLDISKEIKVVMIAFVVVAQLAISGTPAAITIFVEKPTI